MYQVGLQGLLHDGIEFHLVFFGVHGRTFVQVRAKAHIKASFERCIRHSSFILAERQIFIHRTLEVLLEGPHFLSVIAHQVADSHDSAM